MQHYICTSCEVANSIFFCFDKSLWMQLFDKPLWMHGCI